MEIVFSGEMLNDCGGVAAASGGEDGEGGQKTKLFD